MPKVSNNAIAKMNLNREKKVADEREFELDNTPDELERKKKIKEWKEEAGK